MNKFKIILIFINLIFINLIFATKEFNSGQLFSSSKDYYIPENLNYYSGSFSEQACSNSNYITIPLGSNGGLDEGNLSSFLLTQKGSSLFIALDAGTVWQGVRRLTTLQEFNRVFNISYPEWATLPEQRATWFIKNHILGYFIGHSHLDHVGGLIIESAEDLMSPKGSQVEASKPDIYKGIIGMLYQMGVITPTTNLATFNDPKKSIIASNYTVNSIMEDLFNNKVWPNLPGYGRYNYYTVADGVEYNFAQFNQYTSTQNAAVSSQFPFNQKIKAFEICHDNLISNSFLFTDTITGEQIAFFSDTGLTTFTGCDWESKILKVWRNIKIDKLKAIYIESSFTNEIADAVLFGHLRPKDIMKLLDLLLVNSIQTSPPTRNLKHVKLIVEHIKPQVAKGQFYMTSQRIIYQQLKEINTNGIKIIIPNQGVPICF